MNQCEAIIQELKDHINSEIEGNREVIRSLTGSTQDFIKGQVMAFQQVMEVIKKLEK